MRVDSVKAIALKNVPASRTQPRNPRLGPFYALPRLAKLIFHFAAFLSVIRARRRAANSVRVALVFGSP